VQERFLDVSHEALIRGWPRLRLWLDEDRAGLRLHRRITDTAEEWDRSNRDEDLLFRGARLIQALEWRARHEAELNPLEREFLDESILLKRRLEEQERHQQEQERLHKDRVRRLLRQRIFSIIVLILTAIILVCVAALGYLINQQRARWKQTASQLNQERGILTEKGKKLRETAKAASDNRNDPIRNVTALRNLALALELNRQDVQAARMASNLLLQHVWCPPAASEVRYRQDRLLAAAFAPHGSNNEIFAVAGDGQLLFWNGRELSPVRSLFKKPRASEREVMQPAFASFSPNGQWLFVIAPTLVSAGADAPYTAHDLCKIQTWHWSMQNRTYKAAGEALEFQRLRGSRTINFEWSPESDRVVLINALQNEAECAFFEIKGSTFQELRERSNELNRMKIVALAFSIRPSPEQLAKTEPGLEVRSAFVAVSVDSVASGAARKVSAIDADDLQAMPVPGGDSIRLSEGFLPDSIAFGPGSNQLTLTSWSDIRILNLVDGTVAPVPPPTFRDQFIRIVVGPGDFSKRLVAKSLYGRVEVAKGEQLQKAAEPAPFSGSIGVAQFSSDGQRLLILSGGIWNVFDRMRLIDVSPLYRTREVAPEMLEDKPAPPWLVDIASAVSALDTTGDGSLLTLETVGKRYPESKAGDAYEAVWKRFFPESHQ
jgi:hypothetical protein